MESLNFAPVREAQQHEEDLSRMNDEGCPNDPVLSLPDKTGIEGARNTFGTTTRSSKIFGLGR